MAEVTINYKDAAIATMDASGTKTLQTQGRYCEDDIEVVYERPSGGGGISFDDFADAYFSGGNVVSPVDGAIEITVNTTRHWAFTETLITSAVVHTTGEISGYAIRERTFSNCRLLADVVLFFSAPVQNKGIGQYAFQNCPALQRVRIVNNCGIIFNNAFASCPNLTDIYVPWSEGAVANAPWGATNATIHYDTVFDADGTIIT